MTADDRILELAAQTEPLLQDVATEIGRDNLRERHLQKALEQVSDRRSAPLSLEHWLDVGRLDLLVEQDVGLELKWAPPGSDTLGNCAWDIAKLATAIAEGALREGYIVAGASAEHWGSNLDGVRLFQARSYGANEIVDDYDSWWRTWCRRSDPPPAAFPASFDVTLLEPIPLILDGVSWELCVARVTAAGTAWRPFECPHAARGEQCAHRASIARAKGPQ